MPVLRPVSLFLFSSGMSRKVNGALVLDGTLRVTDIGGFGTLGSIHRLFNYTWSLTDNGLNIVCGCRLRRKPGSLEVECYESA